MRLTTREREIATLAAQGMTNRAIAERLLVSVRTVEGHVQRVYTKIGINRRDQLAVAFATQPLHADASGTRMTDGAVVARSLGPTAASQSNAVRNN
jgi:DNA-binding CsgD family transcriptional regulator